MRRSHLFLEGRRYALEVIQSAAKLPEAFFAEPGGLGTIADNLRKTDEQRPEDYAKGIKSVLAQVMA